MKSNLVDSKTFEKCDYTTVPLGKGDYESCIFINCDFSGSDLSDIRFLETRFANCNFSMANLNNTILRDVRFMNCKMLGVHFKDCSNMMMAMEFEGCTLDLASFYKLKLKNTRFRDTKCSETDFSEADLNGSVFDNCDLDRASFGGTMLEQADLRTSFNFNIDPEYTRIRGARFSIGGLAGLLRKYELQIDKYGYE